MSTRAHPIPRAFIAKRLQSIAGLWLVVYLFQHLLVNSQAALFVGNDGLGFIESVNSIHELPYLPIIELAVLAVPILIHMLLGIKYLRTSEENSFGGDGKKPYLPEYGRNRAYTWQRITSWLLIVGIIAHVIHMRFIEYPSSAQKGHQRYYMVKVEEAEGIQTLGERLDVALYSPEQIEALKLNLPKEAANAAKSVAEQTLQQDKKFIHALESKNLTKGQIMAVAKDFGTAELLMVRETFKSPLMIFLYTLFVLAACFHGFNGLFTFMIKWGITLTQQSQRLMLKIAKFLMVLTIFFGLSAIFLTYWVNLRY